MDPICGETSQLTRLQMTLSCNPDNPDSDTGLTTTSSATCKYRPCLHEQVVLRGTPVHKERFELVDLGIAPLRFKHIPCLEADGLQHGSHQVGLHKHTQPGRPLMLSIAGAVMDGRCSGQGHLT